MSDDRVSAYLDGAMEPTELAAFERALADEPELADELESTRQVRALLRDLPWRSAPAGFIDDLVAMGSVDAARRKRSPHRIRRWAPAAAAVAAVSLAVLVADESEPGPVRPAIDEAGDGHVTNAGLADDPILLLAPAAGDEP